MTVGKVWIIPYRMMSCSNKNICGLWGFRVQGFRAGELYRCDPAVVVLAKLMVWTSSSDEKSPQAT